MKIVKHAVVVLVTLFLILGIPILIYVDIPALFAGNVDAVTTASMVLPEQPSGQFVILFNPSNHPNTYEQWSTFFSGEDAGVIMSDIVCMVADSDATGVQLAQRFQARLPENQMQIYHENGLLLVSKAEYELFDVIILSQEMADAYKLETVYINDNIILITVKGE